MDFDSEALIRAVVIGVAVTLLGAGILKIPPWNKKWKEAILLVLAGLALTVIVGVYYSWPSLVKVPLLDNLSEDKAKDVLERKSLVPHPQPRHSIQTERGRVIPNTQNPPAGQSVKKGRIVEFAVAVNEPSPPPPPLDSSKSISIFQPKSKETFELKRSANGLYTGEVLGTFTGLKRDTDFLLLWIRPIDPPSDKFGWYLQRHPNGIRGLREDGSWLGTVQIGNAAWPPQDGHIIDIAVSVVDKTTHTSLMSQGGEAMNQEPVGSKLSKASEVVIKIKQKY